MRITRVRAVLLVSLALIATLAVFGDDGHIALAIVSPGTITTVAGGGAGDGGAATSSIVGPVAIATDSSGNVYILDQLNCRVRKVFAGNISTVAGNGACEGLGDGGPATDASLYSPSGLAVDAAGNILAAWSEK